jgi:hypothetical protein
VLLIQILGRIDNSHCHLLPFTQVVHSARQILQGMVAEEVLESLGLHVGVLLVVKITGDVSLSVDAVILVEPVSRIVSLGGDGSDLLLGEAYKASHA